MKRNMHNLGVCMHIHIQVMSDKITILNTKWACVSLPLITPYSLHVNYLKEKAKDSSSGVRIKKSTIICLLLCYIFYFWTL